MESGQVPLLFNVEMTGSGVGQYYTPEEGWQVFWEELNGDPDIYPEAPERSTDVKCSNNSMNAGCKP